MTPVSHDSVMSMMLLSHGLDTNYLTGRIYLTGGTYLISSGTYLTGSKLAQQAVSFSDTELI